MINDPSEMVRQAGPADLAETPGSGPKKPVKSSYKYRAIYNSTKAGVKKEASYLLNIYFRPFTTGAHVTPLEKG